MPATVIASRCQARDAANRGNQGRLPGPIRAQQGDDFPLLNIQARALQGFEPTVIGFANILNGDDGQTYLIPYHFGRSTPHLPNDTE